MLPTDRNALGSFILALMAFGTAALSVANSEVTCDSRPMRPGEICEEIKKGEPIRMSYEEKKTRDTVFTIACFAGGAAGLGATGWFLLRGRQRRREEAATAVSVADFMRWSHS